MARLAFFGTPDFAVPSLEALLESEHEVALVVCQPDRPKGRGKKMQAPPVKERALAAGCAVAQPPTLKKGTESGDAFFEQLTALDLDLGVVTAYGRIIPGRVLRMPRRGFVNVHGSLLPRWRGAAPVQRAIEAGDAETGVGLMDMIYALDEGDVYVESKTPITDEDDAATLAVRLAKMGHDLLAEHLESILDGSLNAVPQPDEGATYAHMLKKDEATVRWDRPARDVFNQSRAMVPWPGSQTTLAGEVVKLFGARLSGGAGAPGTVLGTDGALSVACAEGAVSFSDVQAPGKRRMSVRDFVAGRPIEKGTQLG